MEFTKEMFDKEMQITQEKVEEAYHLFQKANNDPNDVLVIELTQKEIMALVVLVKGVLPTADYVFNTTLRSFTQKTSDAITLQKCPAEEV